MPYLDIFRLEFEKAIVTFEIGRSQIGLIAKFGAKIKILNLGPKMPGKDIFELEFF